MNDDAGDGDWRHDGIRERERPFLKWGAFDFPCKRRGIICKPFQTQANFASSINPLFCKLPRPFFVSD